MSNAKVQIKIGLLEFHGEGEQDWVTTQLDKILEKFQNTPISKMQSEELPSTDQNGTPKNVQNNGNKLPNLPTLIKEKNGGGNQNQRFLITAIYLQKNGKGNLTAADVSNALRNAQQAKLSNPSDCLNQNVAKGFCEKTNGNEFFVSPNGFAHLSIEE